MKISSTSVITTICCVVTSCLAAWQENAKPKMYVQLGEWLIFYYHAAGHVCRSEIDLESGMYEKKKYTVLT